MQVEYAPGIVEKKPFSAITNHYEQSQCSICFIDFDRNSARLITLLTCNHIFHTSCIDPYLLGRIQDMAHNRIVCPLCRGETLSREDLTAMRNRFNPVYASQFADDDDQRYDAYRHGEIPSVETLDELIDQRNYLWVQRDNLRVQRNNLREVMEDVLKENAALQSREEHITNERDAARAEVRRLNAVPTAPVNIQDPNQSMMKTVATKLVKVGEQVCRRIPGCNRLIRLSQSTARLVTTFALNKFDEAGWRIERNIDAIVLSKKPEAKVLKGTLVLIGMGFGMACLQELASGQGVVPKTKRGLPISYVR